MTYSSEDSEKLSAKCLEVLCDLNALMREGIKQGALLQNKRAQEYMNHGAIRRIMVLRRSLENIFHLFPPSLEHPLKHKELCDVQLNLHAFMINLYGIFENFAWAFVHLHDLKSAIGDRKNVGLFIRKTQKFLPPALKDYLVSERITKWHEDYLKNYRDALAHRIPLYIPPATFTPEEEKRYNQIVEEQVECIKSMRWDRLDELWAEQEVIGRPCFYFLHSSSKEEGTDSLVLHSQILCDAMVVVEFGKIFLRVWHERAYPSHGGK